MNQKMTLRCDDCRLEYWGLVDTGKVFPCPVCGKALYSPAGDDPDVRPVLAAVLLALLLLVAFWLAAVGLGI